MVDEVEPAISGITTVESPLGVSRAAEVETPADVPIVYDDDGDVQEGVASDAIPIGGGGGQSLESSAEGGGNTSINPIKIQDPEIQHPEFQETEEGIAETKRLLDTNDVDWLPHAAEGTERVVVEIMREIGGASFMWRVVWAEMGSGGVVSAGIVGTKRQEMRNESSNNVIFLSPLSYHAIRIVQLDGVRGRGRG